MVKFTFPKIMALIGSLAGMILVHGCKTMQNGNLLEANRQPGTTAANQWSEWKVATDQYPYSFTYRGPVLSETGEDRNFYHVRTAYEVRGSSGWEKLARPLSERIRRRISEEQIAAADAMSLATREEALFRQTNNSARRPGSLETTPASLDDLLLQSGFAVGNQSIGGSGIAADLTAQEGLKQGPGFIVIRDGFGVSSEKTKAALDSFKSEVTARTAVVAAQEAFTLGFSSASRLTKSVNPQIVLLIDASQTMQREYDRYIERLPALQGNSKAADDWAGITAENMKAMSDFLGRGANSALDRQSPIIPDVERSIYLVGHQTQWQQLSSAFEGAGAVLVTSGTSETKLIPLGGPEKMAGIAEIWISHVKAYLKRPAD